LKYGNVIDWFQRRGKRPSLTMALYIFSYKDIRKNRNSLQWRPCKAGRTFRVVYERSPLLCAQPRLVESPPRALSSSLIQEFIRRAGQTGVFSRRGVAHISSETGVRNPAGAAIIYSFTPAPEYPHGTLVTVIIVTSQKRRFSIQRTNAVQPDAQKTRRRACF
jgi:hypothetical protein